MQSYEVVLTQADGTILQSLARVQTLHMEFHLKKPSVIPVFTIGGRIGPEVDDISELATDLIVYRNDDKLFRGRIHYAQDNIGPERHTTSLSVTDYRGLLDRRILWTNLSYTDIDQSTIAWNLINYTQGLSGGNLGITRGTGQTTGITRDRPYEAGQNVGEVIQQLSEVINGFHYEVDADLKFNVYYPERGSEKNFVLDLGGNVVQLVRTLSSEDYANAIRVNGEDNTLVSTATSVNISTVPEGRWDYQEGFTDVNRQATLDEKATYELDQRSGINPSYTLTLAPDRWTGPSDLWIGDKAQLVIKSGRLDIVTTSTVQEVDIKLDENGREEVLVTVGVEKPELGSRLINYGSRLTTLERN